MKFLNQSLRQYLILALSVKLAALAALSSPSFANSREVSIPVIVSEKAENGVVAKHNAMDKAIVTAFHRILTAYSAGFQRQNLPPQDNKSAMELLGSITQTEENIGLQHYTAKYLVTFSKRVLQQYFAKFDVRFIDRRSPPILVFPIIEDAKNQLRNLKTTDRFYKELRDRSDFALVSIVAPTQDTTDRNLDMMAVLNRREDTMKDLQFRYGVRQLLVPHIKLGFDGNIQSVKLYGDDELGQIALKLKLNSATRRVGADQWTKLADDIVRGLEERWKTAYAKRDIELYGTGAVDITRLSTNTKTRYKIFEETYQPEEALEQQLDQHEANSQPEPYQHPEVFKFQQGANAGGVAEPKPVWLRSGSHKMDIKNPVVDGEVERIIREAENDLLNSGALY